MRMIRPKTRSLASLLLGLCLVATAGCAGTDGGAEDSAESSEQEEDRTFPAEGSSEGKRDVFGRSLVGAPKPYPAESNLSETELESNMRLRRRTAWRSAKKVLEPVKLLALKGRAEERPECPEEVDSDALRNCSEQGDETSCTEFSSNGHSGICQWDRGSGSCQRACDQLTLPEGEEVPKVPRWQSWYGIRDVERIFREAYGQLSEAERLNRSRLTDPQIGRSFFANNTAVERSERWPLWRYQEAVMDLFGCDLQRRAGESEADYRQRCVSARQSRFSGAAAAGNGISRVMYSPAAILHTVRNYAGALDCRDERFEETWCGEDQPCTEPPENFSTCFRSEFPVDVGKPWLEGGINDELQALPEGGGTVLIKASWRRVGFDFELPAFDTDAEALERRIGGGAAAYWGEEGDLEGDRTYGEGEGPGSDEIYTIETRTGQRYRLTGLHIMTKELRHWMWITLWWSDEPDSDFGADRPSSFDELPSAWSNYKMCVVVDYEESDPNVLQRFEDYPSLQNALAATDPEVGAPTWCSNPYIEHGQGNARTNCIGCHQHAGTNYEESSDGDLTEFNLEKVIEEESDRLSSTNRYPANGRLRRRTHFPTDYAWTFDRLDNLTELIRTEVEHRGSRSDEWLHRQEILDAPGDPERGEAVFRGATEEETCTDCHGERGLGEGIGPNLEQRFSQNTDWQLLSTIIDGRDRMPAWGDRLSKEELTDLMAFLEEQFGS